ncbi:putative histone H3.v1 [Iris pallida]|uniref:Histone H3.v1 n=1 Tax=Iris pallida TaxID=29817 RepID=A0AAX6E8N2_IRIPA|nr:putative histone H3.v1 [Iris pallida]
MFASLSFVVSHDSHTHPNIMVHLIKLLFFLYASVMCTPCFVCYNFTNCEKCVYSEWCRFNLIEFASNYFC